jgi:DNA polymerase bacteriophage-type
MIYLDYETFSYEPIMRGAYNYANHRSTKILLIAYKLDDEPTRIVDLTGSNSSTSGHSEFFRRLTETDEPLCAWNAQFEYYITKYVGYKHGIKPVALNRFVDAMAVSSRFGYPLSLDRSGKAVGLSDEKQKIAEGKRLIKLFCVPDKNLNRVNPKDHKERWGKFVDYAMQDVDAMVDILKALPGDRLQEQEIPIWMVDTIINERGIMVDKDVVENAVRMMEETKEKYQKEIAALTNGQVTTGQQVSRMLDFIGQYREKPSDLTKETVAELLKQDLAEPVRKLLDIRVMLGKSSVSKYQRMIDTSSDDNRIRGMFQYNGAYRTGRWGGRGVQPHSMPRGKFNIPDEDLELIRSYDLEAIETKWGSVPEVLSSAVRQMFQAKPGHVFHIVDYSGIENRVVAWLAQDNVLIDRFVNKIDQYKLMASKIYKKPAESITKDERFIGKQVILGCGYSMGGNTFANRMEQMGVVLNLQTAESYVQVYREEHPKIVKLWYSLGDALIKTLKTGRAEVNNLRMIYKKRHLFIILPNGKQLCFPEAQLRTNKWGKPEMIYKQELFGKWVTSSTYGAKVLENIAQAISRELLAEAILKLEDEQFPVVLHVHDEIVCEVPDDGTKTLEAMETIMKQPNSWAKGLPLEVEGFSSRRYRK